nr:LINE-type retrotransposon LIb DNA [Ipomoea batatas]
MPQNRAKLTMLVEVQGKRQWGLVRVPKFLGDRGRGSSLASTSGRGGGRGVPSRPARQLNEWSPPLDGSAIFQFGSSSLLRVGNRVVQRRRLDRVLWNMESQINFHEAKVAVLPRLHFDHHPIMFMSSFLEFIKIIIAKSKHWNLNVFGNIFKRKRQLEARIKGLQQSPDYPNSEGIQNLEHQLILDLNNVLDQEETLWFQKARVQWIREGDRYTRFYHNSAIIKRNRNRIWSLKLNGVWTDDEPTLKMHVIDFFSTLFCRVPRSNEVILSAATGVQRVPPGQSEPHENGVD